MSGDEVRVLLGIVAGAWVACMLAAAVVCAIGGAP